MFIQYNWWLSRTLGTIVLLLATTTIVMLHKRAFTIQSIEPTVHAEYSRGYATVVYSDSYIIQPDLSKNEEYRTSQLVTANGKVWPSRKILYATKQFRSAPETVLVLALDANDPIEKLDMALKNRQNYCKYHKYGLFARYIQDFAAEGKPARESLALAELRMLRQAMHVFPSSQNFWLYTRHGLINDMKAPPPGLNDAELAKVMESELTTELVTIKNFASCHKLADIIVSYDHGIISANSILLKRSVIAKAFLELVADPIMQNWKPFYSRHDHAGLALTHTVRWHSRLVKSMALIPPIYAGLNTCTGKEEFCLIDKVIPTPV